MGLVTGSLIAAGLGAAGSIAGGVMQGKSQKKAADAQVEATRETNEANYRQFREARGEGGSAILPLYLPAGAEQQAAQRALNVFNAITGQPVNLTLQEYQNIVNGAVPTIAAGDQVVQDIFSGAMERDRLAREAPVAAARTALADTQAQGVQTALQQRLNEIRADEAARGYTGSSSFANNRLLEATIPAQQAAASTKAQARLENEQSRKRIGDEALDLQIRSLDVPFNRIAQNIGARQAPADALARLMATAQSPLSFFRIAPGTPPRNETPQISSVPSTGAIIGTGLGAAAGQIGNILAQQELARQQQEMANQWLRMFQNQTV